MHQFDLLYMPSNMLYGNKYKYILSGIDTISRYKVTGPLKVKQVKGVAEIITNIYMVGLLIYPLRYSSMIMAVSSSLESLSCWRSME